MNLFLDTSVLVKLYFREEGTEELDKYLNDNKVKAIYLSEITKIEFSSAIWKKVRTKELDENDAKVLQNGFKKEHISHAKSADRKLEVDTANDLIVKYGSMGLRTLDAIQLSCVISEKEHISHAKSADRKLEEMFRLEGINH